MKSTVNSVYRARVKLKANGRIVIPVAIREALGVKAGQTLLLEVAEGVLRIESFEQRLRQVQDELNRQLSASRSLAGELIAERREEAQREQEEPLQQVKTGPESLRRAS